MGSEPVSINGMWRLSVEIQVFISGLDFLPPPVVNLNCMWYASRFVPLRILIVVLPRFFTVMISVRLPEKMLSLTAAPFGSAA